MPQDELRTRKEPKSYSDLCKKCQTPNLCLDFGLFSDCLKGKKSKNHKIKSKKTQKLYGAKNRNQKNFI